MTALAEAPFDSLYHHFPDGKGATRRGGAGVHFQALYEQIADDAPDAATGITDFFTGAAQTLADTDFADACPIATVAGETASSSERLQSACAEVFESWIGALRSARGRGLTAARARELSLASLMLLEGGFLMSETLRSTDPMAVAGGAAARLIADALAAENGAS